MTDTITPDIEVLEQAQVALGLTREHQSDAPPADDGALRDTRQRGELA